MYSYLHSTLDCSFQFSFKNWVQNEKCIFKVYGLFSVSEEFHHSGMDIEISRFNGGTRMLIYEQHSCALIIFRRLHRRHLPKLFFQLPVLINKIIPDMHKLIGCGFSGGTTL